MNIYMLLPCFFITQRPKLYLSHACLPSAAAIAARYYILSEGIPTRNQVGVSTLSSPAQKSERVIAGECELECLSPYQALGIVPIAETQPPAPTLST